MNGFETILPFLKPIEHLILDDSISEVMVNGPHRVFVEKAGFVEEVRGLSIGEKSLMVAVKNIARRLGDDISESKPILDSRLPDGSRVAAVHSISGFSLLLVTYLSGAWIISQSSPLSTRCPPQVCRHEPSTNTSSSCNKWRRR